MNGLMEQIKPEFRYRYDNRRFPLHAAQALASNIRHLLMQEGKLQLSQFVELNKLIESQDIESVNLAIYTMEALTNKKFTKE